MDIIISKSSQTPLYEQIYEQIVIAISIGSIKPNSCLPSIRAMARQLNVSVITTQKAYEELEANGYTYTIPSKGCFISEQLQTFESDKFELVLEKLSYPISYIKSLEISLDDAKKLVEQSWQKIDD